MYSYEIYGFFQFEVLRILFNEKLSIFKTVYDKSLC